MICAKCEWIVSPLDDKARRADHFVHLRPVGQRLRQALVEARGVFANFLSASSNASRFCT